MWIRIWIPNTDCTSNGIDETLGPYVGGQYVTCVQNSWVEIFNMMDLAINNLTQQNKELKRTVNELGSKVNKVSINYDETVYDNTSVIIII
jgi:hypothetical protein